ncbi:MAG: hypothetical protein KBE65_11345 [Phycisphaerae bacterium]|nr:hypothetical protein [Phycisphaerae bacterium]
MNRDYLSRLIDGLADLRKARATGDKAAVEAACKNLDEHAGSMEKLFRALDERRKAVRPSLTVETIIEWIERESRRPSRWTAGTWGMMSEDFEFEALRRWLSEPAKIGTYQHQNRVDWNPSDPSYYTNTDAIADAHKAGNDHEIEDLEQLNPDKLNKLLRSHRGRTVRFMSREKPPFRGRVHKDDWHKYLQWQVGEQTRFETAVEEQARERANDKPPDYSH